MSEDRNDATHAYCRKCSNVQPILWSHFTEVIMIGITPQRTFEGMEAKCEVCGFEIAKIGNAHTRSAA